MEARISTIEGGYAVLEMGTSRHKIIMPLQYLPAGIREGDVLNFKIEIARRAKTPRSKVTHIEEKMLAKKRPGTPGPTD